MTTYYGIERRMSDLKHLALFVEIGVNYSRTIGPSAGMKFMSEHGVSQEVAVRVTAGESPRRLTQWEKHLNEDALRCALGARPLLTASTPRR